ncbi:MAG: cbb3-type cytochrome oxidase assembly protein CcoS [Bacteroidota bacterium]
MSVIIVLIGFSLVVAIIFLAAFLWSVKTGQYEDDYTPSVRILFEDEKPESKAVEAASDIPDIKSNKSNKS